MVSTNASTTEIVRPATSPQTYGAPEALWCGAGLLFETECHSSSMKRWRQLDCSSCWDMDPVQRSGGAHMLWNLYCAGCCKLHPMTLTFWLQQLAISTSSMFCMVIGGGGVELGGTTPPYLFKTSVNEISRSFLYHPGSTGKHDPGVKHFKSHIMDNFAFLLH